MAFQLIELSLTSRNGPEYSHSFEDENPLKFRIHVVSEHLSQANYVPTYLLVMFGKHS